MAARRDRLPAPPPPAAPAPLEGWVRAVLVLGTLGTAVFVALGFESAAPWHRRLYLLGPLLLGLGGAALLALGLFVSALRRPVLQRGRLPALLLAGGCLVVGGCPLPYPSPYADRTPRVELRLPVEGTWSVRFGGEGPFRNPLRWKPDRRFGIELWRTGPGGEPDPAATAGATVLAPADGEVVGLHRLEEDGEGPGARVAVALRLEDGSHAFLRGLAPDGMLVDEGADVTAGEPLGVVGAPAGPGLPASLGLHLQDTDRPGDGVGLPLVFGRLLVEGEPRERVVPAGGIDDSGRRAGWRVAPAPVPPPARAAEPSADPPAGPAHGASADDP